MKSFEFKNDLRKETVYEFASSRPDLMVAKQTKHLFRASERKDIDIFFPAKGDL